MIHREASRTELLIPQANNKKEMISLIVYEIHHNQPVLLIKMTRAIGDVQKV
jgi:hypothetical protein